MIFRRMHLILVATKDGVEVDRNATRCAGRGNDVHSPNDFFRNVTAARPYSFSCFYGVGEGMKMT